MTEAVRFPIHDSSTAVGVAAARLADLEARHGRVGTMVATMAGSPSVLVGYLDLSRAVKRTKLTRAVTERISLAVQDHLDCAFCLEAHTDAARAAGLDDSEISLARAGTSDDPAIAPIIAFGRRAHQEPASITAADIDALRALGLRDRDVLDIVALVVLNVFTGTFNLVAGLEPDPPSPTTLVVANPGPGHYPNGDNPMNNNTFTVVGMTCGHCVRSVKDEVGKLDGVESVAVDLSTGVVTVESTQPIDDDAFAAAIDEAGYEVSP